MTTQERNKFGNYCPTPSKEKFVSRSHAEIVRALLADKGRDLSAYRCECESYHLGRRRKWRLPRPGRTARSKSNRARR